MGGERMGSVVMDAARSLWSNRVEARDLVPGDHIYSWRNRYVYGHHGVYVGDDDVIHFTQGKEEVSSLFRGFSSSVPAEASDSPPCATCSNGGRGVIRSCLSCFLAGGSLYRFKYGVDALTFLAKVRGGTCTMARADPAPDVIHRAKYLLDHGFGNYDLFCNNCEDFALYCKTGLLGTKTEVGSSGQAAFMGLIPTSAILSVPGKLITTGHLGTAVTAVGFYLWGRYAVDIGARMDTIRVPVEALVETKTAGGGTRSPWSSAFIHTRV